MDAYKLAKELDIVLEMAECDNRVPRMLRQQADRIAELEIMVAKYQEIIASLEEKLRFVKESK